MGKYDNFIQSVRPLSGYCLEVVMQTGALIQLLFRRGNMDCVRITTKEFMDMVMVDRT